jgi:hypothetical protein
MSRIGSKKRFPEKSVVSREGDYYWTWLFGRDGVPYGLGDLKLPQAKLSIHVYLIGKDHHFGVQNSVDQNRREAVADGNALFVKKKRSLRDALSTLSILGVCCSCVGDEYVVGHS